MPLRWKTRFEIADAGVKATGVMLAGGSLAFATQMIIAPDHEPKIAGIEHLAIYARPLTRAAVRDARPPDPAIDYTPIGATPRKRDDAVLSGYQLLDASPGIAVIRLPEGRIMRVSPGSRLARLGRVTSIDHGGGAWRVVTESGVLQAP